MNVARTRIGRVIMKNGGADVRVLHRDGTPGPIAQHMRLWSRNVLTTYERPPDAYAAVAFWFDEDSPGRPAHNATYMSRHHGIPQSLLVKIAAAQLVAEHAIHCGAARAIEDMGGSVEDWTPDGAG